MSDSENTLSPIITTPGDVQFGGSGSFSLGTNAIFFFSFSDIHGQMYDPSSISAYITDPTTATVETDIEMDKIDVGKFSFIWQIPADAITGKYTIYVTYTAETVDGTVTGTLTEDFVVTNSGPAVLSSRQVGSRAFLESLLRSAQHLPVYNEPVRFNRAKTVGKLTFPRWNQSAGANVYINNELVETGYAVDYFKGYLAFDKPLASFDEVHVDYNFRWFTDGQLDDFIAQGVNYVNIFPPASFWDIDTIPNSYVLAAEYSAAVNAIRAFLFDLQFQEPSVVFGGPERANQVFSNLETLKRNYEDDLKLMLEQKKYGPYPTTRTISTPEFTLPGGRCLAGDTLLIFRNKTPLSVRQEQSHVYTNTLFGVASIRDLYIQFENNRSLEVLSDVGGKLGFASVGKIWKSGTKECLRITDSSGRFIDASRDHLVFVGKFAIPASELRIGDPLTVMKNDRLTSSPIVSIQSVGERETYDIEVPETENLIANGIKCHNSRWFRYLFK